MTRRGFSVLELLLATLLFTFVFSASISFFRSLTLQMGVGRAVNTVTSALRCARFEAVAAGVSIKVEVTERRVQLYKRLPEAWLPWRQWELPGNARAQANAKPVFTAIGSVSPLCTILVTVADRYLRKISIALTGRVKIVSVN